MIQQKSSEKFPLFFFWKDGRNRCVKGLFVISVLFVFISFFLPFSQTAQELAKSKQEELIQTLPKTLSLDEKERFWNYYALASRHWLYYLIPRSQSQIYWYHIGPFCLWALFGNDDDGIFGEGPRAVWRLDIPPTMLKAGLWALRNPFHNYTFYLLGCTTEARQCDEFVLIDISSQGYRFFSYTSCGSTVFSDKNYCFFVAFHSMRPFISLRYAFKDKRKFECFCGWRERGNFGLKMALRSESRDMYESLKPNSLEK